MSFPVERFAEAPFPTRRRRPRSDTILNWLKICENFSCRLLSRAGERFD